MYGSNSILKIINILFNQLIFLRINCIDKPLGASLCLGSGYPLYGIGSGIGSSPRAGLSSSLWVSLGVRLKGSLTGSIWGRGIGCIVAWLRGSFGFSLLVSLWGSIGSSLRGRLVCRLGLTHVGHL